jgi:hypothetical protein
MKPFHRSISVTLMSNFAELGKKQKAERSHVPLLKQNYVFFACSQNPRKPILKPECKYEAVRNRFRSAFQTHI